jgi:hypothetical protein
MICFAWGGSAGRAQEQKALFDTLVGALPPAPHQELFGARMQRTMSLLADSTKDRRLPVTILIYGQSIEGQLRQSKIEQALREKFPNADITFLNRSISGFSASQLVRSMANDVYPLYPDLIIFHDMGVSLPEFERMVENVRRYTTADILLWTDTFRGDEDVNSAPEADEDSAVIRHVAQKYNAEFAEVHEEMRAYLKAGNLSPKELVVADLGHLNPKGLDVVAGILLRHFQVNTLVPNDWMRTVRCYEAKRLPDEGAADGVVFTGKPWRFTGHSAIGENRESALKLNFVGNRVDCVLGALDGLQAGTAKVLIDGKSPSTMNELWAFSIPSPAFGTDWQPAIRRVTHRVPLIAETWKLKITKIDDDASHFSFEVYGSKTGFDGAGEFDGAKYKYGKFGDMLDYAGSGPYPDVFVSKSGRVVIDYRDFKIPWARTYSGKPCPPGFEVKWEVVPLFTDTLRATPEGKLGEVRQVTLAKGLANGPHTLEIVPNGDGALPIESIVVHEPPLK